MKRIMATDVNGSPVAQRVSSLLSYSQGFVCSLGSGRVCLFVKNENDRFTRSRDIWVKKPPFKQASGKKTPINELEIEFNS